EVGVAFEAELLGELDHAGLADAQRIGQLLRRVVAQQVRVLQHEIGDAPLHRGHLVAFRTDFDQRRHQSSILSRPRISRMPRPGASVTEISDSLKITPPSTGLNWHSEGPSRSILVIALDFATATCTAAATLIEVSSMQPIMHSMPCMPAMSAMRIALEMPPVFISLMLMMSAARRRISSITSIGPNTLSSAITGVCTRSVTYRMPSRSRAFTGCSISSSLMPASS